MVVKLPTNTVHVSSNAPIENAYEQVESFDFDLAFEDVNDLDDFIEGEIENNQLDVLMFHIFDESVKIFISVDKFKNNMGGFNDIEDDEKVAIMFTMTVNGKQLELYEKVLDRIHQKYSQHII